MRVRVVDANGFGTGASRNTASATLVVNHLGLQALEFKFTVAHDPGASDAEREPRRAGASRKREPSVSMSPTRALVRERTALLAQLVYEALRVGERDGPRRADGDGTADSNSGTAAPFEMSPARAADIAAAADAAVSKARGGLDGEAALARAFEAAAAARGDVGGASASRRLSETDNSDNSTPRPIVRDAAALVSLKRLAVTMAAEMHARGDLRAASSFRSAAAAETRLKKEKPQKEVDPRTARARAALRDATRARVPARRTETLPAVFRTVFRAPQRLLPRRCVTRTPSRGASWRRRPRRRRRRRRRPGGARGASGSWRRRGASSRRTRLQQAGGTSCGRGTCWRTR